jgi:RNA polymerase sigma factor (sigma-70 family)
MNDTPFSPIAESNLETAVNYFGKCLQYTYKRADEPLLSALHMIELHCFLLFACSFLEPFLSVIADAELPEEIRLLNALHVTAIARLWHDEFGNLHVDDALPVVFSVVKEQLSCQPTKNSSAPLVREARKQINQGGTGRHPKREHEKADTSYRQHEDDRTPLEREAEPQSEELAWLRPKRYDPEEIMERTDLLRQIFANLTEEEEAILRMYADGHTDAEVATLLGTTPEGVKKRRQRLINRLRQAFAS